MKHISILVPESAVMEAVADPRYAFTAANQFLVAAGKQPLFQVQLVGNTPEVRAPCRNRTSDLLITSQLLYQLS
jgi:hypothetical protein